MAFKVGDVVRLKSGGPHMTVEGLDRDQSREVSCYWFSDDGKLSEAYFPEDALEAAEPDKDSATWGSPGDHRG